jgi:hypothetical protein
MAEDTQDATRPIFVAGYNGDKAGPPGRGGPRTRAKVAISDTRCTPTTQVEWVLEDRGKNEGPGLHDIVGRIVAIGFDVLELNSFPAGDGFFGGHFHAESWIGEAMCQ